MPIERGKPGSKVRQAVPPDTALLFWHAAKKVKQALANRPALGHQFALSRSGYGADSPPVHWPTAICGLRPRTGVVALTGGWPRIGMRPIGRAVDPSAL